MEADLDLGDKLRGTDKELSGERLIDLHYTSQKATAYSRLLHSSTSNDRISKTTPDPVLHRPTTPGQLRQSNATHTVNSLVNSLAVRSQSDGFDNLTKKPSLGATNQDNQADRFKSHSSESIQSSLSSNLGLDTN